MYCGKCGAKINDDVQFCTECGERVHIDEAEKLDNSSASEKYYAHEDKFDTGDDAMTLMCPKCAAAADPESFICPECGYDLTTENSDINTNEEIFAQHNKKSESLQDYEFTADTVTYSEDRDPHARAIIIVICSCFVIALCAMLTFYEYKIQTHEAELLYKEAYDSLYETDATFISSKTKDIISHALTKSNSNFVSGDVRDKISKLYNTVQNYARLAELEDMLVNDKGNLIGIQSKFESITDSEVKNDERYKNIRPYVEAAEFKQKNKKSVEKSLIDLKENNYDTISSWSRSYHIKYYTGDISLISSDTAGIELLLTDYNGEEHTVYIHYNFNEDNSWDDSITKIKKDLENSAVGLIAAAVAEKHYEENVFLYNYMPNYSVLKKINANEVK